jgi:hypothetical protein
MTSSRRTLLPVAAVLALATASPWSASTAGAQVSNVRSATSPDSSEAPRGVDRGAIASAAREGQRDFERIRRDNLPALRLKGGGNGSCDEQVGRFCYWYDEDELPPPPEPERIREARTRLLALLDSAGLANPADRWIMGQRVRYLTEADRSREALEVARRCPEVNGWWCPMLVGFAQHMLDDFVAAESSYAAALALMSPKDRCDFTDLTLLLDDGQLKQYRQLDCDARPTYEAKLWFLARPFWSMRGNDARTEYYARVTYAKLLEDAPSAHEMGFDRDEEELLLRYSWPRAWSRSGGGILGGVAGVVGHEPSPALPYIPNSIVADNPTSSDSVHWRRGVAPIRARYSPAYATPLLRLPHQAALFRRGDSALVALAYDVTGERAFDGASDVRAALVLTTGDSASTTIVRGEGTHGVMTATHRWGPVLMSAEVLSAGKRAGARARYGVRPPYEVGARVKLSDILLYRPYDAIPQSLEEALPHALPSLRVRRTERLGFFWESYGTRPTGEPLEVSLVVVREDAPEPSRMQRLGRALRLWKEAAPVSVSLQDVSARGSTTTARAMAVDISTLTPGRYVVQLEVEVSGQYVVRAERTIEVIE